MSSPRGNSTSSSVENESSPTWNDDLVESRARPTIRNSPVSSCDFLRHLGWDARIREVADARRDDGDAGQSFEQLTVFGRFLRQKNGIANMLMAGLCVRARPPPRSRAPDPIPEGTPARRIDARGEDQDTPPRFSASAADLFFRIPFSPTSRSCCALSARRCSSARSRTSAPRRWIGVRDGARGAQRRDRQVEGRGWFRGRSRGGAGDPRRGMAPTRAVRGSARPRAGKAERRGG